MALTPVKSIKNALNLVETKKENLKKAFKELQLRSSMFSSFNLTWTDLDSHFTSLESELLQKFSTLEALVLSQTRNHRPVKQEVPLSPKPVPARSELKSLCENMDALGLCRYIIERPKERAAIRVELADAFMQAPDPGSLVLDALEGFWDQKVGAWSKLRTACTVLLEEFLRAGLEIKPEVSARAKMVAMEWKDKMSNAYAVSSGNGDGDVEEKEEDGGLGRLGYLQLLVTYKLLDDGGYDKDELINYVVSSARYQQALNLCRIIGLEPDIPEVISRLIGKGKALLALKFIFEFELTDEFPPVPLLKAYAVKLKRLTKEVCDNEKNTRQSMNDAAMKEINALKSVIKCIEDHGLESQYRKNELTIRINKLKKQKADKKRPAAAVAKPQQKGKPPKQNGNKRMKPFIRKHNLGGSHSQPLSTKGRPGLLPGHDAPYASAPVRAYGMVGPSANPYGWSGDFSRTGGNSSTVYPQHGYYDNRSSAAATTYDGYDVPSQYHSLYYHPQ